MRKSIAVLLLILAACTPPAGYTPPAPNTTTLPTAPVRQAGGQPTPTQPAPQWREPAVPVTLDNAAGLTYLGRLDAPDTPSTAFAHAVALDGTRLAILNNTSVIGWDLVSGALLFTSGRRDATRIFFSADKTEVYTLDNTGLTRILNADTGVELDTFQAYPNPTVTAYYGEDGWLALGGEGGEVRVWDPLTRTSLVTFPATDIVTRNLAFSADGMLLAASDLQGTVSVWRWRTREQIARLDAGAVDLLNLTFSPEGDVLAVATANEVQVWSVPTGERTRTLGTDGASTGEVLRFSPDGAVLVAGGAAPQMFVWEAGTGAVLGRLPGIGGDRTAAVFSPEGDLLLTAVRGGAVNLWNVRAFDPSQQTVSPAALDFGVNNVLTVDWTPDGRALILIDAGGPIYIWGLAG